MAYAGVPWFARLAVAHRLSGEMRDMRFFVSGIIATAFGATSCIGSAAFSATPVAAAPVVTAMHRAAALPGAVIASRPARVAPLQFTRALLQPAIEARPFFTPLTTLPLGDTKHRINGITGLLPRLAFAALIAPSQSRRCLPARPAVPISVLQLTPFAGSDCFDATFAHDQLLPPTSLVAAHDRSALYAPTYTPKDDLR